jgi:hypothetical protein
VRGQGLLEEVQNYYCVSRAEARRLCLAGNLLKLKKEVIIKKPLPLSYLLKFDTKLGNFT